MTTTGIQAARAPDGHIVILSNIPVRAADIEARLAGIPEFAGRPVTRAAIKKGLENRLGRPRLIIFDAEDGRMDPLQWVKQIHGACPNTPLVLIASTTDPLLASRALRAGASGYVASEEFDTELPAALTHIAAGERYVSEDVMQGILHGIVQTSENQPSLPVETLSDREMMVFQLLGEGKIIRAIADELGVNIKTVATHCNNIRRKLHTENNRQLTRLSRDWVASRSGMESTSWSTHHS